MLIIKTQELQTARHLLSQAKALKDVNNWLYRHEPLLGKFGIITGEQAATELKRVAKQQIDKSHYAGAMTTLRKLHDIYNDDFYDYNSYELVTLKEMKHRIFPGSENKNN